MAVVLESRDKVLRSIGRLPPFSPVLNRVLATLSSENVSFGAVADLIEKDTVLAGNVLKIVNSALYGRRGTINSVRHAVSLPGVTKLRNAALSMSIARMWASVRTPAGWSMARFNLHSVAVAILCDLLAQQKRVEYAEGAFAAGLLHDVGQLLIAIAVPADYRIIEDLYAQGKGSWCECEQTILGLTHAEISAEVLAVWNLPGPICNAVAQHHSCLPTIAAGVSPIRLSVVLCAADSCVRYSGHALRPSASRSDEPNPEPFRLLAGDSAESIIDTWQAEFDAVASFF